MPMMPLVAEDATQAEWSRALKAIREVRAGKASLRVALEALMEYGDACYQQGIALSSRSASCPMSTSCLSKLKEKQ